MSDIPALVKRLRERSGQYDEYGWHSEIEIEAADALEAQAKEIAKKDTRIAELEKARDKDVEAAYVRCIRDARIAGLDAACERLMRGE